MPRLLAALALGLSLLASWLAAVAPPGKAGPPSPLSPEQARKHFRLAPGLRIELVASEPHIESPVAMAFDEDGRLWVVEMRDYPNGPRRGEKPQGRIKVLEDKDGDGIYETSRLFAEGLLFANGLLPWKGGVLVTAAPHIAFLADSDGDGKADKHEVLYEGFAALNPQLRVSHPVLGRDGWVYVANGLRGGQVVRAGKRGAIPTPLSGMDFRFDPLGEAHEAISGMGQFGNTFDDWGQRFVCDNRHHLRHIVIENRYLRRNPFLAAGAVALDISELEGGPLSSGGKVYPLSKNWTTSSLHTGRFTAACGVLLYQGAAFTCEPTGNLVHKELLTPHGATFRSRPDRPGVEFLATPDDWFRPVSLAHGPDGGLYVVDMYRAVIEHPEFMPPELKERPDLTLGKDRGRIWRIVPEKWRPPAVRPRLSKASTAELVKLLEHEGAWWRTTGQRLLLERRPADAVEPLERLCAGSKEPRARLLAAWLLRRMGRLSEPSLLELLADRHPRIREQAVFLSEPGLPRSEKLQRRLAELADDPDARVRYQVALSLGEWDDDRILGPLTAIARRDASDYWARLAVASAVPRRAGRLLGQLLAGKETPATLIAELAALVGARRDSDEVRLFLRAVHATAGGDVLSTRMAAVTGLAEGMGRRGVQLGSFLGTLPASGRDEVQRTEQFLTDAARLALDAGKPAGQRLPAVRLLAHAPWAVAHRPLAALLETEADQEVRLAAVRSLASHPRAEVGPLLLGAWSSATPAVRREVVEALMRRPERIRQLLDQIEAGKVKPGDLDALRTRQLVQHRVAEVRERARKLLRDNLPAERKAVLAKYQAALTTKGDAGRGKAVFTKHCATCHHVAGVGVNVGPDIGDTRTKTAEMLLGDILVPNQAIDSNYINYTVTTRGGRVLSGIIVTETAASLTLKRAENQTDTVLRQDVEEIASTGLSLMPEGLEKNITVAEMADLLAFLKNWRYQGGN